MSLNVRSTIALALIAPALAVAGCGGAEESAADRYAAQAEREAKQRGNQPVAETEPVEAKKVEPTAGERDLSKKPEMPKQDGEPPTELVAEDLIVGKGAAAKEGDTVTVQYVGVLFENNKEFDTSWGKDEPFEFTLGQGQVIDGWDQGVAGMKEGGRRRLIIPADLAYGEAGSPPNIPANAALVFTIDLKEIGSA
jgi:peptidylprolyl isomerase